MEEKIVVTGDYLNRLTLEEFGDAVAKLRGRSMPFTVKFRLNGILRDLGTKAQEDFVPLKQAIIEEYADRYEADVTQEGPEDSEPRILHKKGDIISSPQGGVSFSGDAFEPASAALGELLSSDYELDSYKLVLPPEAAEKMPEDLTEIEMFILEPLLELAAE